MESMKFLDNGLEKRFLVIQNCLVPRSLKFTPDQKRKSVDLVNRLVEDKSPKDLFRLKLFLRVIDVVSFFYGFSAFSGLNSKKQIRVMNLFFDSPIPLLRKGFWGLN